MEILRDQYLDDMTFRAVERPLLAELFGPLVGLEATPEPGWARMAF